jgi:hypothetical protein
MSIRVGAKVLDMAPTAWQALYYLYVLALLVLCLEAEVDPAVVAAVGRFVEDGYFGAIPA